MCWRQVKLKEMAEFTNGGAWSQSEYSETGVPVVRVSDVHEGTVDLSNCKYLSPTSAEQFKKHLLSTGDLIICTVGSHPSQPGSVVGRPGIVPKHADGTLLNQNAVRIRPICAEIDKRWLGYIGQSEFFRNYIISCARGSANQVRMAIGLLMELPVSAPPLETQRKIASILSAYDDLIENNTRRIKILEEMARMIYREWFVNFRFPGHEQVKMIDSLLGMIPEGWEVKALGEIADVQWGDTSTTKASYVDEGYKAFSASGADGKLDHFDFDREGIVLSAIGANCGLTWYTRGKWSCIKNTIRFWAKKNSVSTEYLYFATHGIDFWPKRGAAQPFISQGDAKNIQMICSNETLVKKFTQVASDLLAQMEVFEKKNQNLRQTRDLLLPKLISGEVDVDELGFSIEAAL